MTMARRARRLLAVVKHNRHDPYLHGRALEVSGAALFAESLPGVHNPLGRKGNAGIVAVILAIGIVGTMLFFFDLGYRRLGPYPNGETTTGHVVAVTGGIAKCTVEARYAVAGQSYVATTTSETKNHCRFAVGDRIDVSYQPTNPSAGRPVAEEERLNELVLRWSRVFLFVCLVALLVELLVEVAVLVLGGVLILRGRRRARHAHPAPFEPVLDELQRAWDIPDPPPPNPVRSLVASLRGRPTT